MTVESSAHEAMAGIAAARERYRSPWLARLFTALAVAVLSWTLGSVYWQMSQVPRASAHRASTPEPGSPQATDLGAALIAAAPFGRSRTARAGDDILPGVRLRGVIAWVGSGGQRRVGAVVNRGGTDEYIALGKEIIPGVVLEEVQRNQILVRQGARLQRVVIEDPLSRSATPGLTAQPRSPNPPPPPNQAPPAAMPGSPAGPLGRVSHVTNAAHAASVRIPL